MDNAGEKLYCLNTDEWITKIRQIKAMTAEERKALAKMNFDFVNGNFSDEVLDSVWYEAFNKLSIG